MFILKNVDPKKKGHGGHAFCAGTADCPPPIID